MTASSAAPELILHNGRIATQDERRSFAEAAAIRDGRFLAVSADRDVLALRGPGTRVIDLGGRTVIPGLNDSHLHVIRGGLNYNLELRWDGVPSLADGLRMLREQAARTPAPQWVRVVGGWSEFQFAEKRLPTLDELNEAAPDTPVFVLHLYCQAMLNRAALRAVGYDKDTPNPPGGEIRRDKHGNPTGLLIARPNATILYATLAKGPKLPLEYQYNSTRQFMRELNRLGLTSVIDAGGGYQNYPEDYQVIDELHQRGELTLRIAYNLFTQKPQQEKDDFARWIKMAKPGQGDDVFRLNGAGEMLVFSAADFEDFLEPRPDLPARLETDLEAVVSLLAANRWPFRLHATYDESITRFLDVFEKVNQAHPLDGLHWFLDHAETISDRNIERVRALGGGIAVQHRMAFQGEYFAARYGHAATAATPPVARMLRTGVPVGAGTDATRVANYNPWDSLYWLVSGRTVGGFELYPEENRLSRMEALRLYTVGSAWFSTETGKKGSIVPGQLADLAVLTEDYFTVPEERIKRIQSVLTVLGGKVVHAAGDFDDYAPPPLPVTPDWSPASYFGGYGAPKFYAQASNFSAHPSGCLCPAHRPHSVGCQCPAHGFNATSVLARLLNPAKAPADAVLRAAPAGGFFGLGCDCFAF
ncbi:amidohydrolase [Termitidicoccus mucosus]|uniref:Amidohydrolase n=1 Tax=Termitidicoccus mucosus TaxID=1184151 RepID=A0A178ILT3_9BACT|nr:amidohydrolase [Opitutaceae bacterium TSB47]